MSDVPITFSFGANWKDYVGRISEAEIDGAMADIEDWLGRRAVAGKTVLDVGSGSGIHSLAFHRMGARRIVSFDYDRLSVEATRTLWEKEGRPGNRTVSRGSVLDDEFVRTLGRFDVVYAWGVLHATGDLWRAVEQCCAMVERGGTLWISVYAKGPEYARDLAMKERFNAASVLGKRWTLWSKIARMMLSRARHRRNPFGWNENRARGMNVYHDLVDWLGGLPYEVANADEIERFCKKHGFVSTRKKVMSEGSCSIYVFSLPGDSPVVGRVVDLTRN